MPPKDMAARVAKPSAKTVAETSGPKETRRVGQPIWTPASTSCSEKRLPLYSRRHEDIEVLLLQLLGDFGGDLLSRGGAQDGGKAGGGAVHELHAAFAQDDVIGGAQPDVVVQRCPPFWYKNRAVSRYRMASMISSAKRVAMPASSAGAR